MGWEATLALGFRAERGRTRLAHRSHRGPLFVQRPFYPEGGTGGTGRAEACHVYVLHPPGGLVSGDDLRIDVDVGSEAAALVTTPAAGKVYRSNGAPARQGQTLAVRAGGALEWLPQETIVYDGADVTLATRVELGPGARFLGLETLCFGLPARDEPFRRGTCRQAVELWRDGRPLFLERARFTGGGVAQAAPWGFGGATVLGLLVATPAPPPALVEELRELARAFPERIGITVVGERDNASSPDGTVLVCRLLGHGAEPARTFFHETWRRLRPALFGRAPVAPRIWAT